MDNISTDKNIYDIHKSSNLISSRKFGPMHISYLDAIGIYSLIIIVSILFVIVALIGSMTTWFINLIKPSAVIWIIILLWATAIIISYIGLIILWTDMNSNTNHDVSPIGNIAMTVAPLVLIGTFLSLGWIIIFFYVQNLGLSIWTALILFSYEFWLFIYIWYINPITAVLLIPLLLIYIYLIYFSAHLAYLNNVSV